MINKIFNRTSFASVGLFAASSLVYAGGIVSGIFADANGFDQITQASIMVSNTGLTGAVFSIIPAAIGLGYLRLNYGS